MKNLSKLVFFFMLLSLSAFAQNELRGSMGVNFVSCGSARDYINQNFASHDEQVAAFHAAIDFSAEYGRLISDNFQLGIEYAYSINSFSINNTYGQYEFSYYVQSPTLTGYYVMEGEGYKLKFGGGAGPRFISVDEKIPPVSNTNNYTSTGFGILARADGATSLGGDFYAYIGGELRCDFNGEPKSGNNYVVNYNKKVNLNSFSAGLKLGITYLF